MSGEVDFETKVLRDLVIWVREKVDRYKCLCHIFNGAPCCVRCAVLSRIDADLSAIEGLDDE